jgi:hypothetical protein
VYASPPRATDHTPTTYHEPSGRYQSTPTPGSGTLGVRPQSNHWQSPVGRTAPAPRPTPVVTQQPSRPAVPSRLSDVLPSGWYWTTSSSGRVFFYTTAGEKQWERPTQAALPPPVSVPKPNGTRLGTASLPTVTPKPTTTQSGTASRGTRLGTALKSTVAPNPVTIKSSSGSQGIRLGTIPKPTATPKPATTQSGTASQGIRLGLRQRQPLS